MGYRNTFGQDENLHIMLSKESENYSKKTKNTRSMDGERYSLLGQCFMDSGLIECYLDNIAKWNYGQLYSENKDVIEFASKGNCDPVLKDKLERHTDYELLERVSGKIDSVVTHELSHRLSGSVHPKDFNTLLDKLLECTDEDGKPLYENVSEIKENRYDNQKAKELLSSKGITTYTTLDFNNAIERAMDWYSPK